MKPTYIAIGIKNKEIIALALGRDYEKVCEESKERVKELDIDEYKIFDFTKNGLDEYQWWMLEHDITNLESIDIIKDLLSKLLEEK